MSLLHPILPKLKSGDVFHSVVFFVVIVDIHHQYLGFIRSSHKADHTDNNLYKGIYETKIIFYQEI